MLKWFIIVFIILLFVIIVSVLIWYNYNFKSTPFKENKSHLDDKNVVVSMPSNKFKDNTKLFKVLTLISDIIISLIVCLVLYLYLAVYGLFIEVLPIISVIALFIALLTKSIIKF